jgi:hypothetical protein
VESPEHRPRARRHGSVAFVGALVYDGPAQVRGFPIVEFTDRADGFNEMPVKRGHSHGVSTRRSAMARKHAGLFVNLMVAIMVLSSALPIWAQGEPASNMEIVREKIRADKKLMIAENMEMTEDQAKAFWPIYENYQKDLARLGDRMVKLIQAYANEYQAMSDGVAKKLTDEYLDIESERQGLRKAYLPKFRKVLPDTKVARYYQLEQKIYALGSFELAAQIPLIK